MIRLIANLLTEDSLWHDLKQMKNETLKFFQTALKLLSLKNVQQSEECVLNIVACFTNFLFYDT